MKQKYKKLLLIEGIIIIMFIFIYMILNSKYIYLFPQCVINKNLGILCPSCGGTRCISNFLVGNIGKAFRFHMIFSLAIIYLMILNIVYIIDTFLNKKILPWIYPKLPHFIIFLIGIVLYTIIRNII